MDQEPKQQQKRSPLVLVLIIIIVLLAAAAVVLVVGRFGEKAPETENLGDATTPLIGYEEGVTALDEDTLQKAVDEAYSKAAEGGIPLEFENDASSPDGEKLKCYIANPAYAKYDIYVQMFTDETLTEQLYLSGLIPPGKAMREIYLNKRLDKGTHRVYVALTQVEEDHATIHQQAIVTMDLHVEEQ